MLCSIKSKDFGFFEGEKLSIFKIKNGLSPMEFLSLGVFGGDFKSTRWPLTYAVFDFLVFFLENKNYPLEKSKKIKNLIGER